MKGVIEVGAGSKPKKRFLETVLSKPLGFEDDKSHMP
jgi:hypothetical protein